jgi:hypothetical protein
MHDHSASFHGVGSSFKLFRISPARSSHVKQNLSALALMLPYLEQTSVYNSFNFDFGADEGYTSLTGNIQATATNTSLKVFQCPSDPLAGAPDYQYTTNTNNYYASVGTSMYWSQIGSTYPVNTSSVNMPSTGLFTFQRGFPQAGK